MSIFYKVVKSFLTDMISNHIDLSKQKDTPAPTLSIQGLTQTVSTLFKAPRDINLSTVKQNYLSALITHINSYSEEGDDLKTARIFLSYLRQCKSNIDAVTAQKKREPGTTEPLLDQLITFVEKFHKKMIKLQLVEQVFSDDIFSGFLIAIASYHAKRLIDDIQLNWLKSTLSHPSITNTVSFQQQLDQVVNETLRTALDNIASQNLSNEAQYQERKDSLGTVLIKYLRLEHRDMHSEHMLSVSGLILPYYLDDYLKIAALKISSREPVASIDFIETEDEDYSIYTLESEASGSANASNL